MQLLDALLLASLESHLALLFPDVPECLVGVPARTQFLDVGHGLQSVSEKGLEQFRAAAATLPVITLAWRLVRHGGCKAGALLIWLGCNCAHALSSLFCDAEALRL